MKISLVLLFDKQHIKTIVKRFLGIILMILGLVALLTPFTPGARLIFIGAELLGIRLFFREKFSGWRRRFKERNFVMKVIAQ